jgi:hypothetical protein
MAEVHVLADATVSASRPLGEVPALARGDDRVQREPVLDVAVGGKIVFLDDDPFCL